MNSQHECINCHQVFEEDQLIPYLSNWVCVNCKSVFFQKIQEGVNPTFQVHGDYGGFWIRLLARIIDQVLVSIVTYGVIFLIFFPLGMLSPETFVEGDGDMVFPFALYSVSIIVGYGLPCLYETWMVGRYSATLGKMALGLKVYRSDGTELTYMRSFGRYWGTIVSSMTCLIGYIMAAFDDEKRALHDHLCDTRVLRNV